MDSTWKCEASAEVTGRCHCGGRIEGHAVRKKGVCQRLMLCSGIVSFDPCSTSTWGGGLKQLVFDENDPEIENRFEGRCCECRQRAAFTEVGERCKCGGVFVIQKDHMPYERLRHLNESNYH